MTRRWLITEAELLRMLRRAAAGEDPELVLIEEYASSDHAEQVE